MNLKEQLQEAIAYCNTKLASKGVTKPATNVVDIGNLIDAISSSGLPTGINEITYGEFSIISGHEKTIETGLSQEPKGFVLYNSNFVDDIDANLIILCFLKYSDYVLSQVYGRRSVVNNTFWQMNTIYQPGYLAFNGSEIQIMTQYLAYAKLQQTNGGEPIVYKWMAWR